MTKSSKILFSLALGAAAGTAFGLYLSTEAGQETREKLGNKLNELEADFSSKLKTKVNEMSEALNKVVDDAKEKVENIRPINGEA